MKLFMEINPQLFDDCSHEYTEAQSNVERRQAERKAKWDRLAEQAKQMQNGQASTSPAFLNPRAPKPSVSARIDEFDPIAESRRLDALKLQDEGSTGRERQRDEDMQNTVREQSNVLSSFPPFFSPSLCCITGKYCLGICCRLSSLFSCPRR